MTAIKRLNRWRVGAVAAVLAGAMLAALFTIENALPAREEAKAAALPADLAKIPTDGAFLLSVRVVDVWNSELGKPVREKLAKDLGEPVREFEKFFGLSLEQIERLTIALIEPPPSREEPLLFVYTTKAYDKNKVIPADKKDEEQKYKGQTIYLKEKDGAVCPIDDRTLVYGKPDSIHTWIDHSAPKSAGNLAGALRTAAGKHALTIGINVKAFNDSVGNMLPGEVEPFKPLLKANLGTLAVDVAAESRAEMTLTFASEADAKAADKPLRTGLELAQGGLDQGIDALAAQKDSDKIVALLKQLRDALKTAKVEQKGKTLQASASLKVDMASVGVAALEAVQKVREAASRTSSANNLRQIAIAMHNIADTTGRLPAQATYSKIGKPMLSWRVLILPYIEQNELYKEFRLDEPWDSAHNKKLLAKMPKIYASPYDENTLKDHTTYYQGFVGKGAFFEGKQGLRFPVDFPDGTSNTIMIVEAAKAVPWTKPEDIPYDPAKKLPKLARPGAKGFQAVLCDGSVHFIANTIKEMTLRNAITRNDGNPLGDDF
jgi:hypothetical protein